MDVFPLARFFPNTSLELGNLSKFTSTALVHLPQQFSTSFSISDDYFNMTQSGYMAYDGLTNRTSSNAIGTSGYNYLLPGFMSTSFQLSLPVNYVSVFNGVCQNSTAMPWHNAWFFENYLVYWGLSKLDGRECDVWVAEVFGNVSVCINPDGTGQLVGEGTFNLEQGSYEDGVVIFGTDFTIGPPNEAFLKVKSVPSTILVSIFFVLSTGSSPMYLTSSLRLELDERSPLGLYRAPQLLTDPGRHSRERGRWRSAR